MVGVRRQSGGLVGGCVSAELSEHVFSYRADVELVLLADRPVQGGEVLGRLVPRHLKPFPQL